MQKSREDLLKNQMIYPDQDDLFSKVFSKLKLKISCIGLNSIRRIDTARLKLNTNTQNEVLRSKGTRTEQADKYTARYISDKRLY